MRGARSLGWVCALVILGESFSFGAEEELVSDQGAFRSETQVTAVDLLVDVESGAWRQWATGETHSKKLGPADFTVVVDGESLPVVAVEVPLRAEPDDFFPSSVEPWHTVLWLDLALAGPDELRWGASLLEAAAEKLVALGTVEVVVVDESPRRILAPTRNAEELEAVLSQVALFPEGADELATLRAAAVAELEDGAIEEKIAQALVAEEQRLVTERQDLLLSWLAGEGQAIGSRRALFLIQGGFDLQPARFYGQLVAGAGEVAPEGDPARSSANQDVAELRVPGADIRDVSNSVKDATEKFSAALASYGWVTFPLLRPEPELLVEGVRLGKWLFRSRGPHQYEPSPEELDREVQDQYTERSVLSKLGQVFLFGIHGSLEERRDPDLAEAHMELGLALEAQEKFEEAGEAFQKALYHFAEDPRTAERQAVAMSGLGRALAQSGHELEAERARDAARQLDPSATNDSIPSSAFLAPESPLKMLAKATGGRLIRDQRLDSILESLARRIRVTFQTSGPSTGLLRPVDLSFLAHSADVLRFPTWMRSSTPEPVAEARARLLFAGADVSLLSAPGAKPLALVVDRRFSLSEGLEIRVVDDLDGRASFNDSAGLGATDPVGESSETEMARPSRVRWTMAYGGFDGLLGIEHSSVHTWRFTAGDFQAQVLLEQALMELPADPEVVLVLVEDLTTGRWNAELIEL